MGGRTAFPRLTGRTSARRLPGGRRGLGGVRGLHITASAPGRQIAPASVRMDPLSGLHLARTLGDLGRALETEVSPLGEEGEGQAVLAIDSEGRVYSIDHTGDWYLGADIDQALATLVTGAQPSRLTSG